MSDTDLISLLAAVAAVVIVFLYSVEKFGKKMEDALGSHFRSLLQRWTDSPLKGALAGAMTTSVLQSSTAVSVLLVSLSSTGLMSLPSSLAVVIGANVGTTITTQLVAFKLLNIAPYILVVGYLLTKLYRRKKQVGQLIFYFGMMFSCLYVIAAISNTLQGTPFLADLVHHASNLPMALVIGFVVVNILQSCSITTGLIVILASQGMLGLEQSFGLIIGANIGTTTTALLASLATGREGKRVAVGHLLFNAVGAVLFLVLAYPATSLISSVTPVVATQVAIFHAVFNIVTAAIFLIGFRYYVKTVERLLP